MGFIPEHIPRHITTCSIDSVASYKTPKESASTLEEIKDYRSLNSKGSVLSSSDMKSYALKTTIFSIDSGTSYKTPMEPLESTSNLGEIKDYKSVNSNGILWSVR